MPFRLYIDEVGNDDLGHVSDERHRYLSLTGVVMDQAYVRDIASPNLDRWKAEIFQHDPDTPILLHRKDIMHKKGAFGVLNDSALRERFDETLVRYLTDTEYTVISAVIDKKGMLNQRHWIQKEPYHYLMEILVEKFTQLLERRNDIGDVMPEKRQGAKDSALQAAFEFVRENGTNFVQSHRIQSRIRARKLKFRTKRDNITGLQICDLIAHPSHMAIRHAQNHDVVLGPFAQRIIPMLKATKYDRSPYNGAIVGYGVKYLP